MAAIFHMMDMNDVLLNKKKIAKFLGEHKRMTKDRAYTHEEIKMLADTGDYRFRALVLFLAAINPNFDIVWLIVPSRNFIII